MGAGALVATMLATGCGTAAVDAAQGAEEQAGPPPAVEIVPAKTGSLPLVERLSGVARAANQVVLRPEISGVVAEVFARNGDRAVTGQPLVRLHDETEREQLAQARASVDLAAAAAREADARVSELKAQVVRTRALAEQALISKLELETREAQLLAAEANAAQARARVEQTRATVDERRAALERTVVKAPIDGRIGRRNIEVGMRVDPGTPLFVLGSLDDLIVEVPLTEAMLGYLREGQTVRLSSRALDQETIEARLSRISPFLAEQSFSTMAEIDVQNRDGRLRPGMFVTVDVLYGESEQATLVPAAALWEEPRTGEWFVFVVRADPAGPPLPTVAEVLSDDTVPFERRATTILAEGRSAIAVAGVQAGEWIVTVGQQLLAEQEAPAGRVRPTTWERVEQMQSLQREDLLRGFLEKQRRVAQERGATPPPNSEYVGEAAPEPR